MTRICLRCKNGELKPSEKLGEEWLTCEACSRTYCAADIDEIEERLAEAEPEDRDAFLDLLAVYWQEVNRQVEGGGGDDGLRLVVLRPLGDETLVKGSTKVVEGNRNVIRRMTGFRSNTAELRSGMSNWFRNPPDSAELARLKEEVQEGRKARRREKVQDIMRGHGFDV